MTNTKYWLSLLAISVVLVAGSLTVSPVAIADDDDDDDDDDDKGDKERVSVTTNFAHGLVGGPAPAATVLLDTTSSGTLKDVHVAIGLPCPIDGEIPNGASVLVGVAGGSLVPLISSSAENTGIAADGGLCVYHASSVGNSPGTITDVVLSTPSGTPATTATVTGTYN